MKEPSSRDHMVANLRIRLARMGECCTILLSLLQDRNGFIASPDERNEVQGIYDGDAVKVNLDSE